MSERQFRPMAWVMVIMACTIFVLACLLLVVLRVPPARVLDEVKQSSADTQKSIGGIYDELTVREERFTNIETRLDEIEATTIDRWNKTRMMQWRNDLQERNATLDVPEIK